MSAAVIEVESLGKRYHLGAIRGHRQNTFREMLGHGAKSLLRRVREGQKEEQQEFWALRDVQFALEEGEVTGIIGRNGAGKSTLLKILSRITEPTTGRALLRGRVASLLEVGTGFHPELTGRENIYMNGVILGMSRREVAARFDQIAAFAEVEKFLDTPVKHYSNGMQVRLAFAVAAHLEPEVLVVDEVLAVGDVQFQQRCLGRIREVSLQGRTVLLVSHNLSVVRQLCRRALLLDAGRVVQDGAAPEVIGRYLQDAASKAGTAYRAPALEAEGPSLEGIRVSQEDGTEGVMEAHLPIIVEISFRPRQHGMVRCTLMIHDDTGCCVHHSSDEALSGAGLSQERAMRRCELPAHALNRGHYLLTVTLLERGVQMHQRLENVVGFEVRSSLPHGAADSALDWRGMTSPGLLKWSDLSEPSPATTER